MRVYVVFKTYYKEAITPAGATELLGVFTHREQAVSELKYHIATTKTKNYLIDEYSTTDITTKGLYQRRLFKRRVNNWDDYIEITMQEIELKEE